MTNKRILHADANGKALITCPSQEALAIWTIEEIAEKFISTRYKIIDVADIPVDRTFRDAWEYVE